jgi:hypothetical protein
MAIAATHAGAASGRARLKDDMKENSRLKTSPEKMLETAPIPHSQAWVAGIL